jgi:NADH-quinone oxidoreductase subunit H
MSIVIAESLSMPSSIYYEEVDDMDLDWVWFVIRVLVSTLILLFALFGAGFCTLLLRKIGARMQQRLGPNRIGPGGMFQWVADMVKMIHKESIMPAGADRVIFWAAPIVSVFTALTVYAFIPFGEQITLGDRPIPYYVADTSIGLIAVLALSSLVVYGIVMAAWGSNSKYPMLSGLRAGAQVISCELVLGLSLVGFMLLTHSFNLNDIARAQGGSLASGAGSPPGTPGVWLILLQPIGFLIYLISAIAEIHYPPFDVVEAEHELIAGYHTEYSGMQFGAFQAAEFISTITVAAVATYCFLGGWQPIVPVGGAALAPFWFIGKLSILVFVLMWIRWTLPRVRYDQLMGFCWKGLFPLALGNILLTAVLRLWVPLDTPPVGGGSWEQSRPWFIVSTVEFVVAAVVILSLSALATRNWWGKSEVPRTVKNDGLVPGIATGNLKGGSTIDHRTGLVEAALSDRADSPRDGVVHPRSG